ncbi:nucleotidyltransferase family protein [Streptomyces sp. ACA25]|uniref:nucleotidyltransferase family protein n=1 Tax=Streptomyces sp. ACA25 TaxID=3022596 RepID=UPI002308348A|nr:nucleotidyltransferase family protein [Streptomyces sp. ACA25]MDB1086432.1 nucleotidyltransferase family protein [Streptomyces sp. ACA25]
MFTTGIVLAAGASRRLGQPKQLLPYRGTTLLDASLGTARDCGFGQLLVALGGAEDEVRRQVDLTGTEPVTVPGHGLGCGSSLSTAVTRVDPRADGVILLLGDQPGVGTDAVRGLLERAAHAPAGLCRYQDGPGHPLWFARSLFGELATLKGDKAAWKLLHSGRFEVAEHPVDRPVPRDVDTWDDYRALLAEPDPAAGR